MPISATGCGWLWDWWHNRNSACLPSIAAANVDVEGGFVLFVEALEYHKSVLNWWKEVIVAAR